MEQRITESKLRTADSDGKRLLDTLIRAGLDGRPLTDQEILDLAFLTAVASLDTLTQSINFCFRYLAEHSEHQRRLAADPTVADHAAEELLRLHSVVNVTRTATCDTQLAGVHIRKGDRILLCLSLAGRDPEARPVPATADFDRPEQSRHLAFGAGLHRCVGARIATWALATALREWHRRIPAYSIHLNHSGQSSMRVVGVLMMPPFGR
ncbi:MAG: cytochrome P450 [Pseudonocardiaceae bacterium]